MSAATAAELFDLTGETALITGASSGLGARFAEVLARAGARVILAARRVERLEALARRIGDRATAMALDVADPAAAQAAFEASGPVSLLVNNAGIADPGRFLDTDDAAFARVMATNVDAVRRLSREFAARRIAAAAPGAIINVASILSYRVTPGVAAYAVSKAAVKSLTEVMALELARHRIRVNALAPGYIATEMTEAFLQSAAGDRLRAAIPMRRTGEPADLDGALLLLAAPRASAFMTGTTIVADGGHLLSFQ